MREEFGLIGGGVLDVCVELVWRVRAGLVGGVRESVRVGGGG